MPYRVQLPPIIEERVFPSVAERTCAKSEEFSPQWASCSPDSVDLALRILARLEARPAHESATCAEIARELYGPNYMIEQVWNIHQVSELLHEANLLARGRDGYGYQISRR